MRNKKIDEEQKGTETWNNISTKSIKSGWKTINGVKKIAFDRKQ